MYIKVCVLGCVIALAGCRSSQNELAITDADIRELDEFRAANPEIAEEVAEASRRRAQLASASTPSRGSSTRSSNSGGSGSRPSPGISRAGGSGSRGH